VQGIHLIEFAPGIVQLLLLLPLHLPSQKISGFGFRVSVSGFGFLGYGLSLEGLRPTEFVRYSGGGIVWREERTGCRA
jgi:hypothetical protein